MKVYVVMAEDTHAYSISDPSWIEDICLTKDIADKLVLEYEIAQKDTDYKDKKDYWVEEHKLQTGDLIVEDNLESIVIIK